MWPGSEVRRGLLAYRNEMCGGEQPPSSAALSNSVGSKTHKVWPRNKEIRSGPFNLELEQYHDYPNLAQRHHRYRVESKEAFILKIMLRLCFCHHNQRFDANSERSVVIVAEMS